MGVVHRRHEAAARAQRGRAGLAAVLRSHRQPRELHVRERAGDAHRKPQEPPARDVRVLRLGARDSCVLHLPRACSALVRRDRLARRDGQSLQHLRQHAGRDRRAQGRAHDHELVPRDVQRDVPRRGTARARRVQRRASPRLAADGCTCRCGRRASRVPAVASEGQRRREEGEGRGDAPPRHGALPARARRARDHGLRRVHQRLGGGLLPRRALRAGRTRQVGLLRRRRDDDPGASRHRRIHQPLRRRQGAARPLRAGGGGTRDRAVLAVHGALGPSAAHPRDVRLRRRGIRNLGPRADPLLEG